MNRFLNKSLYKYLLLFLLSLLLAGCSKQEEGPVPLSLTAQSHGLEAEGRAAVKGVVNEKGGFSPTLFSTTLQGDYTYTTTDPYSWIRNVTVAASTGIITFPAIASPAPEGFTDTGIPCYPVTGDWMYLVGVHPQAPSANGSASYDIDGKTDILYAGEIKGNKWEGCRFPPLVFTHLLAQLQLKAVKTKEEGLPVKVCSITLKDVPHKVVFPLNTGKSTYTDLKDFIIADEDIADDPISGTGDGHKMDLVTVLLPPRRENSYSMDVVTTIGTFKNVSVTLGGNGQGFQAGYAYEITLNVTDRSLSVGTVTVTPWTTTDADGETSIH